MASKSKENNILKLILENSPLKEWHFEELVKEAKVTKVVANKWLKKYIQKGLLKKVAPEGKFPHYIVGLNNLTYSSWKRVYALNQLYESGFIEHLLALANAKTIIIFGSFSRWDWYKNSDIDIFIYGDANGIKKEVYQLKLQRNIEMHIFKNKHEIEEVKSGLIKNIINGYLVKGQIQDIVEVA